MSLLTLIRVPTIVILVFRSYCPKVYDVKKTEGIASEGAAGSKPHKPFVHSYTGPSVTKTGKLFHQLVSNSADCPCLLTGFDSRSSNLTLETT